MDSINHFPGYAEGWLKMADSSSSPSKPEDKPSAEQGAASAAAASDEGSSSKKEEAEGIQCEGAIGGAIGAGRKMAGDADSDEEDGDAGYDDEDDDDDDDGAYDDEEDKEGFMKMLQNFLMSKLHIGGAEDGPKVLDEVTVDGIVKYILSGQCKNIITMAGAGISTSAGIPDFRTPGSGLYSNLEKYNLPCPEAIFDIEYFKSNPKPFFVLAKELYPGAFNPTPSHWFIRLLHEKGLLLRHYTQNVDTLEHVAGLPVEKVVEAHGTFRTAHCLHCRKEYSQEWMKDEIFKDNIPTCLDCSGVVKPDIVFFRESLPPRFFMLTQVDFPKCDLLIILGTSLTVQPFASLIDNVPSTCPRLLVNREKAGSLDPMMALLQGMGGGGGLALDSARNTRDVALLGDCDDGCLKLAELLGWKDDLQGLLTSKK
ncbi:NAD-dependent protein deacetylase sirtuin-2-like isoform X1 [Macrobrachium rosenbergii]|uniref:NAD-dependent protein deacetylase sirtuin-2-like isoform X1 n=2 Tax=Macrobrachium rosenbergii TaxID=79674 RepID=UPI0034D7881C